VSEPDRTPHLGPETTETYWMGRVINAITTIKDSPMVSFVSSYVASGAVEEQYPDGNDPDSGEPLDPMERLNMILEKEEAAYQEYMSILEGCYEGDLSLIKAGKLASMIAEANYLSLSTIPDPDADLIFARECAFEYAKIIKSTYSMLLKTRDWCQRNGPPGEV
jgi:hypothetical protein